MSSREFSPPESGLGDVPRSELGCLYDDPDDPSELTIFVPETPARTTAWITVDEPSAVSLERHR